MKPLGESTLTVDVLAVSAMTRACPSSRTVFLVTEGDGHHITSFHNEISVFREKLYDWKYMVVRETLMIIPTSRVDGNLQLQKYNNSLERFRYKPT